MTLKMDECSIELCKVAKLNPGDTVVAKCDQPLSPAARENIRTIISGYFPENKIIVLCKGLDIEVISNEK